MACNICVICGMPLGREDFICPRCEHPIEDTESKKVEGS